MTTMPFFLNRLFLLPILLTLLSACSTTGWFSSDDEAEYRSQREVEENLEIPPDLTSTDISDAMVIPGGSSASYSDYTSQQQGGRPSRPVGGQVLPEFDGMEIKRDGNQRWLVIDAAPDEVWFKVVEFWRKNGLLLVEQNPATGVMTTDWLESRADIEQGMLTELFRKAFDSIFTSATRDQFRVRLERGEKPGTTELYLTHRGLEEKLVENLSGDADTTYWTPRPNEPETEAAMLRALMLYLGISEDQADQAIAQTSEKTERAQLIKTDQNVELIIDERFARAWRLTGVALDRVGFAVEDRNRSLGIYYVRYKALAEKDEKGFFSKLAFWRDDEDLGKNQFQIKLADLAGKTRVTVHNKDEERQNTETAKRLLSLLHEQIR